MAQKTPQQGKDRLDNAKETNSPSIPLARNRLAKTPYDRDTSKRGKAIQEMNPSQRKRTQPAALDQSVGRKSNANKQNRNAPQDIFRLKPH